MSAQADNYTLDDFIDHSTACASCGVDPDSPWDIPEDSAVGRCLSLESDGEVCDECFQEHSTVYRAGGTQ